MLHIQIYIIFIAFIPHPADSQNYRPSSPLHEFYLITSLGFPPKRQKCYHSLSILFSTPPIPSPSPLPPLPLLSLRPHLNLLFALQPIFVIMCVDDYEFRHFSARREKVCRKFIIVNEYELARTFYVNISQFQQHGQVALCKILIYLSTKGLVIQNKKFYLPKFSAIIEPFTYCKIIFEALSDAEILIKTYPASKETSDIFAENENTDVEYEEDPNYDNCYCRFEEMDDYEGINFHHQVDQFGKQENTMEEEQPAIGAMIDEMEEKSSSDELKRMEEGHKKIKESQRGIGQVIKAVKIWRQLHQSKRCNLTNAAKVVGISKKSLDDYYLVLRVGQILGFDFANNLDHKMGDLRNFIRSKQQKITGKLGKNVECFKYVDNYDLDELVREYQTNSSSAF